MTRTITIMQLRSSPGEYLHAVSVHRQRLVITKQGKPVAQLVPIEPDVTIIDRNGECHGELPVTFRRTI